MSKTTKASRSVNTDKTKTLGDNPGSLNDQHRQHLIQIFDGDQLQHELFLARCQDTGDISSIENAKIFKEEFSKKNIKLQPTIINLQSMRMGINSIIVLSNSSLISKVEKINLADNSVSDYGMHAVQKILNQSCPALKSLSLASNMISGEGLELLLDELIQNKNLTHFDLGVSEGSLKKNSLGIQGSVCLSALLIKNKTLESLSVNDNDLGPDGGECVGIALSQNTSLRHLKISENDLKSEGAIPIIKSGQNLKSLSIAKNYIKSDVGKPLAKLLKFSNCIQKLSLEFNELGPEGAKWIGKGLESCKTLEVLNLKGNMIGDEGICSIAEQLKTCKSLNYLDISLNEIGPVGFQALCENLQESGVLNLVCSKNFLGDDVMAFFANIVADTTNICSLTKFDFSSCRLNDAGLIFLINALQNNRNIFSIKLTDNFFSENVEAVLLETLNKNTCLTEIALQGNRFSHTCLQKLKRITSRNVKLIEEQEPNKLKAEIYRLRYEHSKLDKAKQLLTQQQDEIKNVQKYRQELKEHMANFQQREEEKRNELSQQIQQQKQAIIEKENQIRNKQNSIRILEDEYKEKMKVLQEQFQEEKKKRSDLENELLQKKDELENFEMRFPQEVQELKNQIEDVKQQTQDYEKKTKALQAELQVLKATAANHVK